MRPTDLPPHEFAEFLKSRRERLWKLEPEPKTRSSRSYMGAARYSDFGSIKRNKQRRRTP